MPVIIVILRLFVSELIECSIRPVKCLSRSLSITNARLDSRPLQLTSKCYRYLTSIIMLLLWALSARTYMSVV